MNKVKGILQMAEILLLAIIVVNITVTQIEIAKRLDKLIELNSIENVQIKPDKVLSEDCLQK